MNRAFVSIFRFSLVLAFIVCAFCALFARLLYLQVWNRGELLAHVQSNRKKVDDIKARRGDIVDSRGNLLATTHSRIDLGVDPQCVRESDRPKLAQLAELIEQPLEMVEQAFDTKTRRSAEYQKAVSMIRWAPLAKDLD